MRERRGTEDLGGRDGPRHRPVSDGETIRLVIVSSGRGKKERERERERERD